MEDHRQLLAEIGQLLSVTGTIILSEEGINVALSGNKSSVEQMFEACKAIPGLQNLEPKSEFSEDCRFSKLKVKVKQEIIKMDQPQIQPSTERAPSIDSLTLKHLNSMSLMEIYLGSYIEFQKKLDVRKLELAILKELKTILRLFTKREYLA